MTFLSNVQGPGNGTEEKQAKCHLASWIQREREKKNKAVKETWVNDTDEDSTLEADSFRNPIRLDLICQPIGKTQLGEGVCLYINYKRCRQIAVRKPPCSPGCSPGCEAIFYFFLIFWRNSLIYLFWLVNIHISWIKSFKKTLKFAAMAHRCSNDFCWQKEAASDKVVLKKKDAHMPLQYKI